jgi:hypothetical protein
MPALGGVVGLLAPREAAADPPGAAPQQLTDRSLDGIVRAIDALRSQIANEREFTEIRRIRDLQKEYLRVNAKLPDFIDVGSNVWFGVNDWHIKWAQPVAMGRDANNRRTIALFETLVILQNDQPPNFVGMPYEFAH